MKPICRWIKIGSVAGLLLALTGCAQVDTARRWWVAWRNPVSTQSPAKLVSVRKVSINLTTIAQHHPAWKLAQQLQSKPPTALRLSWSQPHTLSATNPTIPKSTFTAGNPKLTNVNFAEPEQPITANTMKALDAQMTQEQVAEWVKWKKEIDENLQEDRKQIGQAMRVDLNDKIAQTQKNVPEIGAPFTPSTAIQNEMINLRLKLLNNIALSAADKAATQKRLDQLEAQWIQHLRQQAQQGADKQKYWRETVPRQMREKGEANIQQTLQTLQQQDQKAIDLTINNQQQWLEQDNARNSAYSLTLPLVIANDIPDKSTFQTPALSVKSIRANFTSISAPAISSAQPATASQSAVRQLKQVAMKAAKRAAAQSAARHHWQWTAANANAHSALPDATTTVLREAQFR